MQRADRYSFPSHSLLDEDGREVYAKKTGFPFSDPPFFHTPHFSSKVYKFEHWSSRVFPHLFFFVSWI